MTTAQELVDDTLGKLLSGEREEHNLLAAAISASDLDLSFTYDLNGIQPGSSIAIGAEIVYVWEVNEASRTARVRRGTGGSTAATATAGTFVTVNPKFPAFRVLGELNNELRALAGEGLFAMRVVDHTGDASQYGYDLTGTSALPVLDVYKVAWDAPGPEQIWPRIRSFVFMRAAPTADFPSGNAVILREQPYPGRTLRIWYKTAFSELTTLTSTLDTAFPTSAIDIPPLGAAARMMAARESKRSFTEAQRDPRRSMEVPTSAAARSAAALLSLRTERISSEINRLHAQYPPLR